jgi:Tfp pilus assembly protein PilO
MKKSEIILALLGLAFVAAIAADRFVLHGYRTTFRELQDQWITTANKLATAKILHENLNHVRELVFENMDFGGAADSVSHEQRFFAFMTACVNDLKVRLVAVEPVETSVKGRVETHPYDVELEGDFFSIGELCAKLENSRRIYTLETFDIHKANTRGSGKGQELGVTMRINTYRVRK